MDLAEAVIHPFSVGREVAMRRVVRQFAHKYRLAYLGSVNQRTEEHELIRGVTAAASHIDSHFCVGSYQQYDVSLVLRRDTVSFPEKPARQYRWTIMQIDLRRTDLPHIFIDAGHYDETFYATLFTKFANFTNAAALFVDHAPLFVRSFTVYTPADKFEDVESILDLEVTDTLARHFRQFDYEIAGDRLLVYSINPALTPHILDEMLRVGIWLAGQLERSH